MTELIDRDLNVGDKGIMRLEKNRQNQSQASNQSGFVVLLGMLMLVLGASVWFATAGSIRSDTMSIAQNTQHIDQLHRIKQKMLTYAVLHPEIYSDATVVPGPGYFPCPDADADGAPDTGCGDVGGVDALFLLGRVPYKISSRNFSFIDSNLDNEKFWYAVDARFVASSSIYAFEASQRFAPLNIDTPKEVVAAGGLNVAPITLDGKDEIVMVLFYAGESLSTQSRPSLQSADYLEQPALNPGYKTDFVSTGANENVFNDYVISITRAEWQSAVLSRVSQDVSPEDQVPDLCANIVDTDASWFNDCNYNSASRPVYVCPGTTDDNLAGQGWRAIICP